MTGTATGEVTIGRLRWWQLEQVLVLERALFGPEGWSAGLFWSELGRPETRHYLVATRAEEVVGYAGLCAYADEGFVQTLAVAGSEQGQGLGGRLLRELLAEAARRGLPEVGLEVRADNVAAQRLYRAHGFRVTGVRRGYYQPSGTDAQIMQCRLAGR